MWLDLAYSLSTGRDRTLSRRATRLIDLLGSAATDSAERRTAKFNEFADATPEGNLIQVFDSGNRRLYPQAPGPADFPWPNAAAIRREQYRDAMFHGRKFRILVRPVKIGSQALSILVSGNLEDNRQLLAGFSTTLAMTIPALLALSGLSGYFLSRHALQPVDRLTVAVRSISIGNLSRRLPTYDTGDEIQRLAETCNDMLARLESAFSRINRFTADASHELRSPISFIRTVAEYALRNEKLDADSKQAFEEILTESVEAARLLEDMLVLARADAGCVDVSFEALNPADLIKDVCEKIRPLADAKQQSLVVACDSGQIWSQTLIRGDRSSLRRLLWTLLDNAIKYTPPRGFIEVALHKIGSEARITVRDNGIGIPEAILPRVFERFFRADPSRSEVDGTGLGLAIAKWIADVHHAVLSVQSREGEGTICRVAFPVSEEPA